MVFLRVAVLTFAICSASRAGDVATERTQAVTGLITAYISVINDAISTATDIIQQYEELAGLKETFENWDWEDLLESDEFFEIFGELEEVVRQGQALGHTVEDLEVFMAEKFDTYEGYLEVITDMGEIDEPTVLARIEDWNQSHLDTIRNTMTAHGMHLEAIDASEERLAQLERESRSADGRMQALQVGAEIAQEEVQQLNALKEIVMEQSNLHASYFATKAAMESDQSARERWIRRDLMPVIIGDEVGAIVR